MKRIVKRTFKVHTEDNQIRFFTEWSSRKVRLKAYQIYGSLNFTIKEI